MDDNKMTQRGEYSCYRWQKAALLHDITVSVRAALGMVTWREEIRKKTVISSCHLYVLYVLHAYEYFHGSNR